MTSCETGLVARCRRRMFQFSFRSLLIATVLLAFLLGIICFHFRTHLFLRYEIACGQLADGKPIPALSMPETSEPEGWVPCRFGSMQFRLPPQLAASEEKPRNGASYLIFRDGPRSVLVALPREVADTKESLQIDLKMPPQGKGISLPRLRLEWCQASSADFRWTMSQDEAHWLGWCIAMNHVIRLLPDGWAETMFGADLDGLLFIRENRRRAILDWEANKQAIGGFIDFRDTSATPDLEWVRSVCRSVQVYDERQLGESSKTK